MSEMDGKFKTTSTTKKEVGKGDNGKDAILQGEKQEQSLLLAPAYEATIVPGPDDDDVSKAVPVNADATSKSKLGASSVAATKTRSSPSNEAGYSSIKKTKRAKRKNINPSTTPGIVNIDGPDPQETVGDSADDNDRAAMPSKPSEHLIQAELVREESEDVDEELLLQQRLEQELGIQRNRPPATTATNQADEIEEELPNVVTTSPTISIEEQIRQRIINSEAVSAINVQVIADDKGITKKHDAQQKKKDKNQRLFMVCAALCVIALAIGLGVGLSARNNKTRGIDMSTGGTLELTPKPAVKRREYLLNLLVPLYEAEADGEASDYTSVLLSLDDTDNPRRLAFEWMITMDEYCYDVNTDMYHNYNSIECDNGRYMNHPLDDGEQWFQIGLIERYVAVVFYFATNEAPGGWYNNFNFLNTTSSICDWHQDVADLITSIYTTTNSTDTADNETTANDFDEYALAQLTEGIWCHDKAVGGRIMKFETTLNDLMGTLPFEMSWLSELRHLDVAENFLYGTIPNQFSSKLPLLQRFQLYSNLMTGTLPRWLFGKHIDGAADDDYVARELEHVLVGKNLFTGTIPQSTSIYDQLIRLQFTDNLVTGTIPSDLFDVPYPVDLYGFVVSHNLLTGTVPSTIGKLREVRIFEIAVNQISGTIPSEIGQLTELEWMFWRENQLSGTIPTELGNLESLTFLYLHHNRLTGTIPRELFTGEIARSLEWLILEDNQLTGTLPEDVFPRLKNIYKIDVHANKLTGTIPASLREMPQLNYLELQNNSFTGDLDPLLCNDTIAIHDIFLVVTADCGGEDPELTCSCCNECCDDYTGCPYYTGKTRCDLEQQVSQVFLDGCECLKVDDGMLIYNNEEGDREDAYSQSCNYLPFCQFCNADSGRCALRTDGWYYDGIGELDSSWEQYEYVAGSYTGRKVLYVHDTTSTVCEVHVDGERCHACSPVFCNDGYETIEVRCDNIFDGASFSGCQPVSDGLDVFGVLQVLHPQFDVEECVAYSPGYCEFMVPIAEDILGKRGNVACGCSEGGLDLACPYSECLFCQGPDECFLNENRLLFTEGSFDLIGQITNFLFIPPPFPVSSNGTNVTSDGGSESRTTNITSSLTTKTETLLLTYRSYTLDIGENCTVEVNGQICTSCNRTICPGDDDASGVLMTQINCENLLGVGAKYDQCKNETGTGLLRAFTDSLPACIPYNISSSEYYNWSM